MHLEDSIFVNIHYNAAKHLLSIVMFLSIQYQSNDFHEYFCLQTKEEEKIKFHFFEKKKNQY